MHYAGLGRRFLALLVDFTLFCAVFFPVTRVIKGVWIMSAGDHLWRYGLLVTDPLCIAFLLFILFYFVILEGLVGATVGKWIMGVRVVSETNGKPGMMRSVIRNLLRVVDALPALNVVGVLLILRSEQNARFGDRVAGTRVVTSRSQPVSPRRTNDV